MKHHHHAVVSGRLAGENNTGKEMWMKNCSALLPSAFFVVLSVRNRVNILFHGVCINYLFLSVNVPYWILMFKSITAYLIVVSCCCRLSYRWRLGRSLVYSWLLGMADTKAPRRRLATQRQHSHQPVTTLRATITTPPRLQSITPQLMLSRAKSPKILSTTPRLPITTPPSHRSTTRMLPQLIHRGSQVLLSS